MNEELIRTQKDCTVDEELEHFNKILKQHSERQSENVQIKQIDFPQPDVVGVIRDRNKVDNLQPIAIPEPDTLLDKLHDKKVNLVLVATSLDEGDVVRKLRSTLDPAKSRMIPLKYNNNTNTISDSRSSTETYQANTESNGVKYNVSRKTNKNSEQEKDGRYWKRRTSNNEAAKKSRDARKARLEWIENRAEELELENALLRKQLDNLTQEVLDKEKKGSMIKLV
jgi:hypothetical protein